MEKLPAEEPVKYLVARVREALAQDERTNVLDVQVRIAGEHVYLMGTLEGDSRKDAVQAVVEEILPEGMKLHNNITVVCYSSEPSEETVS